MTLDLDNLEQLARAATGDIAVAIDTTTAGDETYEAVVVTTSGDIRALAAHIAAANPAAVLELIAEVRRLNAIIDLGRATLDRMHAQEQQSHQDWSTIRAELTEAKERVRAAERDSESFREAEGAATRGAVAQLFDLAVNGRPHGQTFLHDDMEQAAQKILALRAIVHDLAAVEFDEVRCPLCGGREVSLSSPDYHHSDRCPYRRAVEAKP